MAITTNRNQFVATHVTTNVKNALREEAKRQHLTVSALIYTRLHEWLVRLGYNLGKKEPVKRKEGAPK